LRSYFKDSSGSVLELSNKARKLDVKHINRIVLDMKTTHYSESDFLVCLSSIYTILVLNALYFSVRNVFWYTHYNLKETAYSKFKIKLFSLPL
jgi:hypothetical protein